MSAAESAADSPGSSSLSPRNPTPNQATGTEQENARNSLSTFAHCFARSHPCGMKTMPPAPWMRPPCPFVSELEGGQQGGNERRIKAILLMGRGERQEWHTAERVSHPGWSCCHPASTTKIRSFIFVTAPAG